MQKYIDALLAHGWHVVKESDNYLRIRVKPRRIVRVKFWEDGSHAPPFSRHAYERHLVAVVMKSVE